jgi:hypothetical protein
MIREVDIQPPEMQISENTVEILEEYLAMARRGEISEVMVVGHDRSKVWVRASRSTSILNQLGALEMAKQFVLENTGE